MNLRSVDYFIMIARERSFSKAANELYITQQTLSANIAALEQELECKLLIRHVPLELTHAGEVFLQYAYDIQQKLRSLRREIGEIANQDRGVLRVGIVHTRGRVLMPGLIDGFQRHYPKIEIQVIENTNDLLLNHLLNGEIDLAIANFPGKMPGVCLRDFYEVEIVLLVSKALLASIYGDKMDALVERLEHSGDLTLLKECPFILSYKDDVAGRLGHLLLSRAPFRPNVRARSRNSETLLELCCRGVGAHLIAEDLALGTLSKEKLSGLQVFRFGSLARFMIHFAWLEQPLQWRAITNFMDKAHITRL